MRWFHFQIQPAELEFDVAVFDCIWNVRASTEQMQKKYIKGTSI